MPTHGRTWLRAHARALTGATALGVLLASPAWALDRPVLANNGMVVAGHPLAVQAGLKVLQAGGNACDAFVATASVLSIAMNDMMGPAGSGYALVWEADSQQLSSVDYNGVAPLATDASIFEMSSKLRGIIAATVPGNLKGWEAVHQRCGTMPWADLWQDAIGYAEQGWPVDVDTAFHIRRLVPEIGIFDSWANEFLIDGQPPAVGQVLRRPDLAWSYRQFAEHGSDALYRGEVGERLVAFMEKENGLIGKEDLEAYEVKWMDPIHVSYRGIDFYGAPPSSSSITWMQMLAVLDGWNVEELGHNSTQYLHRFIEAAKQAHLDAYRYNGDPAFVEVPVDRLLSQEYAAELRQRIESEPPLRVQPHTRAYLDQPQTGTATSHMTIVDQFGNAVSSTNTLGTFFGAGVVAEGTGLVLSNGMDWFDIDHNIWTGEQPGALVMEPGKRNRWTLSPGMAFENGRLVMVVGGAGAEATMWGVAQPIVNVVDFGMNAQAALNAPRFRYGDIYHYTGGTEVFLEPGIADEVQEELAAMGHNMSPRDRPRITARGTTNMIVVHESGALEGGAAPQGRDFLGGF